MTPSSYDRDEERALAIGAAQALDSLKATEIVAIDLCGKASFADFFVIATGSTPLHMRALVDRVDERLHSSGARLLHCEGRDGERWILMDYGGVLVHVFSAEGREYYALERLWGDAESIDWAQEPDTVASAVS